MPRIPAGLVEKPPPVMVAEPEVLGLPDLPMPVVEPIESGVKPTVSDDDFWCLNPDGSIDHKAMTNKTAKVVADTLDIEMDPTNPEFCAGIVILTGNWVGFRAADVSHFTGLPLRFCREVKQNLRLCSLITHEGKLTGPIMDVAETDNGEGNLAFTLYCLVGTGKVITRYETRDADPLWASTDRVDHKMGYRIEKVA